MFEKILYPTDFSEVSEKALGYVKKLREAGTKEIVVLHVIDQNEIASIRRAGVYAGINEELEKIVEENAKKEMKTVETELKKSGFDVKARIEIGIPFREILRFEEDEGISATVLGSHGRSCIKEMFLGSVSEQVIRGSNKPVLVVRR